MQQRWMSARRTMSSYVPPHLLGQDAYPAKVRPAHHCRTRGLILGVLVVCSLLTALNVYELHRSDRQPTSSIPSPVHCKSPVFVLQGKNAEAGHLRHVVRVLERLGFERGHNHSQWDLLWAHEYPFHSMYAVLRNLRPHQKVNHFPGSGYITNKQELSTSVLPHIPVAFKIPQDKQRLLEHAERKPGIMFVQKNSNHRGIKIKHVSDLDLSATGSFVQEYISRPLLVDGYKFDVGVYTILTSINPLRVYAYKGDVLFRFCPEKYYPFDPQVLDKYVVGDDYLPIWEVPSLKKHYLELSYSMKDSFDAHIINTGRDPGIIWRQVDEAIRGIYLMKELQLLDSARHYRSTTNFFEMVRFDFVIDEDLKVFMMEANMSPNLSSAHFPPNQLLYEQVIFNVLSLVGVARMVKANSLKVRSPEEENMHVADKNVMVFPELCGQQLCSSCLPAECQLCKPCLDAEAMSKLKTAYREHVNRQDCRRVFPPPMDPTPVNMSLLLDDLLPQNQLMHRWFWGKCLQDSSWCS